MSLKTLSIGIITAATLLGSAPALACGFKSIASSRPPARGDLIQPSAMKNAHVIMLKSAALDQSLDKALSARGFKVTRLDSREQVEEAVKNAPTDQKQIVLTGVGELEGLAGASRLVIIPILQSEGEKVDAQKFPVTIKSSDGLRSNVSAIEDALKTS